MLPFQRALKCQVKRVVDRQSKMRYYNARTFVRNRGFVLWMNTLLERKGYDGKGN